MVVNDFKYSDQESFFKVCKDYVKYLNRVHLKDFQSSGVGYSVKSYEMGSIGTLFDDVFFDGYEGSKQADAVSCNTHGEWFYDAISDVLYIASDDNPNDDVRVEIGENKRTFIDKLLADASQELNALITSHITPIPKAFIYNNAESGTDDPEFDYILKKAECLIAYSVLLNSESEFEKADAVYSQVTNFEKTGIVDRINSGDIKLAYETTNVTDRGRILEGTISGSMQLVEISGRYSGNKYEKFKLVATAGGGIGTGEIAVYSSTSVALYGNISSLKPNGQFQSIGGGISVRFEGGQLTTGDTWFIECRNDETTNANARSIELWR